MPWVTLRNGSETWVDDATLGRNAYCAEIALRDGPDCHYCRCAVSWDLHYEWDADGNRRRVFPEGTVQATVDHKVPLCAGGSWDLDNLVIACGSCNSAKRQTPYDVFIATSYRVVR